MNLIRESIFIQIYDSIFTRYIDYCANSFKTRLYYAVEYEIFFYQKRNIKHPKRYVLLNTYLIS